MRADTDASSARRLDPVASKPTRHALTIDVEDWFHDDWRPERGVDWDRLPSTVCADVDLLLELLAAAKSRATFFVLGDVAAREPALVRHIAGAGHEIASHGYAHRRVATQSRDGFAADVENGCTGDGALSRSMSVVPEATSWKRAVSATRRVSTPLTESPCHALGRGASDTRPR